LWLVALSLKLAAWGLMLATYFLGRLVLEAWSLGPAPTHLNANLA